MTRTATVKTTGSTNGDWLGYSSKRLAYLAAVMATLHSPTIASTHQRSNSCYRPDSSWRDYSSADNSYHQQHPVYPYENPQSSQIYYSDDEVEEQVLSALAKADDENSSADTMLYEYDDGSSSADVAVDRRRRSSRRRSSRRKRRRKRRRRQQPKLSLPSEEEETTTNISAESGTAQSTEKPRVGNTKTLGQGGVFDSTPKNRPFDSRLKDMESKLREERSQDNSSNINPHGRPWGTGQSHPDSSGTQAMQKNAVFGATHKLGSQPIEGRHDVPSSNVLNTNTPKPLHQSPASNPKAGSHPQHPPVSSMSTRPKQGKTRTNLATAPNRPTGSLTTARDKNVSPWVRKFHSTRPKDCLVLVPREYLLDNFNLARLAPVVEHLATQKQKELEASSPNLEQRKKSTRLQQEQAASQQLHSKHTYPIYRQALELILRQHDDTQEEPGQVIQYAAEVLYTLVHARFVVSPRGLDTIRSRLIVHGSKSINQPLFGRCPRLDCGGMPLLPCGLSDDFDSNSVSHHIGNSKAKRYCCCCRETFHCWESKVDGSGWGTSVCHLLLMVFGEGDLFPSHFATPYKKTPLHDSKAPAGATSLHQQLGHGSNGRIFGFPIHPTAALS